MSAAPRVSIVVPAHNAEKTLPGALKSAVDQTYTSWELVIGDDASTDRTWEIVEEWQTRLPGRIKGTRRTQNGGPAAARNAALAVSGETELIALLDADDLWLPEYLECQVEAYETATASGRRPGIVACDAWLELPDGTRPGRFGDAVDGVREVTYEEMLAQPSIYVGALVSRRAFEQVGGEFSTECWGSEDLDLWLRILEAGYEVVANQATLAVYRLNPLSVSGRDEKVAAALLSAYRRALARQRAAGGPTASIEAAILRQEARHRWALVTEAVADGRRARAAALALGGTPTAVRAAARAPRLWTGPLLRLVGYERSKRVGSLRV